jgi:very-short-patch-repair endonuclease
MRSNGARSRNKALPLDGGGLGGGAASHEATPVKKHPTPDVFGRARKLRQNQTDAEKRLWRLLRSHQMDGAHFRRQVPFGRYVADFACHDAGLIIEIDGGQHDPLSPAEIGRTAFLQKQGYRVLRFWNNEVLENLEGVYTTIAAAPPTTPSPLMEEGWGGGGHSVSRSSAVDAGTSPPPNPPPSRGRAFIAAEGER